MSGIPIKSSSRNSSLRCSHHVQQTEAPSVFVFSTPSGLALGFPKQKSVKYSYSVVLLCADDVQEALLERDADFYGTREYDDKAGRDALAHTERKFRAFAYLSTRSERSFKEKLKGIRDGYLSHNLGRDWIQGKQGKPLMYGDGERLVKAAVACLEWANSIVLLEDFDWTGLEESAHRNAEEFWNGLTYSLPGASAGCHSQ